MPQVRAGKLINFTVLALAVFVFLFALNAKLSLCHPAGPQFSRTAFKLYLNGQKLTIQSTIEGRGVQFSGFMIGLFFARCTLSLLRHFSFRSFEPMLRGADVSPDPHFSRPPPVLI